MNAEEKIEDGPGRGSRVWVPEGFASLLSHDIKNPFNALIGLTDLLEKRFKDFEDSAKKELISNINASSKQLYRLIENIVSWFKINTGRIKLQMQEFAINDLFMEALSQLDDLRKDRGVDVECRFGRITVCADFDTLSTAVWNFVSLLIACSNNGARVLLGGSSGENSAAVNAEYEGRDISLYENRIEGYIESASTVSGNQDGILGLAYYIYRKFIEMNNGELTYGRERQQRCRTGFTLAWKVKKI